MRFDASMNQLAVRRQAIEQPLRAELEGGMTAWRCITSRYLARRQRAGGR